jgi:hypothetical protein
MRFHYIETFIWIHLLNQKRKFIFYEKTKSFLLCKKCKFLIRQKGIYRIHSCLIKKSLRILLSMLLNKYTLARNEIFLTLWIYDRLDSNL